MRDFSNRFEREKEGVFRCTFAANFPLPNGQRIDVAPQTVLSFGTAFMGIDLARILEEYHQKSKGADFKP